MNVTFRRRGKKSAPLSIGEEDLSEIVCLDSSDEEDTKSVAEIIQIDNYGDEDVKHVPEIIQIDSYGNDNIKPGRRILQIESSDEEDTKPVPEIIQIDGYGNEKIKPGRRILQIESSDDEDIKPGRRGFRIESSEDEDMKSEDEIVCIDSYDEEDIKHVRQNVYVDSSDEDKANLKPGTTKRRRIAVESDDSDSSYAAKESSYESDGNDFANISGRFNQISVEEDLEQSTIDAELAEKERRKRLSQRQKEFNGIEYQTLPSEDGTSLVTKLKKIILDDDAKSSKPKPVEVHPKIVRFLKNYQSDGIKFMFQSTIESLQRFRNGDAGGGAILAHCMGLGKTLQTISFIHTVLSHKELSQKIAKVLIVVPKNVVLNWRNEFDKWLINNHESLHTFDVMELDSFKTDRNRMMCLRNWYDSDGPCVMIIGYDLFRLLVVAEEDKPVKKHPLVKPKKLTKKQLEFKKLQVEYRKYLQNPGPDLIVCDEAHKLKNSENVLAKTMLKIKTRRRVCLTGTPLQNNLMEYYVMVSFVKPGLLGTKSEFDDRFARIIQEGCTKDAGDHEVKMMKKRCVVLFERLNAVVQRKDISVLKQEIPGKAEYILKVRLTPIQAKLYQQYLDMIVNKDQNTLRHRLFADYHIFSRIWTHPFQLEHHFLKELYRQDLKKDKNMDDFIDDGETLGSSDSYSDPEEEERLANKRNARHRSVSDSSMLSKHSEEEPKGWWSNDIDDSAEFKIEMSNKLIVLMDIIKRCEAIGDKLLVFSQSLESLRLIREFLEHFDKTDAWYLDGHECLAAGNEKWGWKRNYDYMVIDGTVSCKERDNIQNKFNSPKNFRTRLMLISTRAGSLGTNMVAGNRVVIFDSCWNPSHDTQSLFRVYRIGQQKPVYIYRLVAAGTMEECIYKRQVTKDSTALRVIDAAQIERHFQSKDLKELYQLNYDPFDPECSLLKAPPKDRVLGDLLLSHPDAIVDYLYHDNLFEDLIDEKLTEDEVKEAWTEYEKDKNNPPKQVNETNKRPRKTPASQAKKV